MTELTLTQLLLANAVLAAGACLQGVAGYGIGTLGAPLLFLIDPMLVPAVLMLNALVMTTLMSLRHRHGLALRPVVHAVGGSFVGTVLAALTLAAMTAEQFEVGFGALILLAVGVSVLGGHPPLTPLTGLLAGGASGYMGTITGVGGPPVALVYQSQSALLARANLSAFFLVSSVMGLAGLTWAGYLGRPQLAAFALTFPGVAAGFWASGHLVRRLPGAALRPAILAVAAIAGASAVIRGLL